MTWSIVAAGLRCDFEDKGGAEEIPGENDSLVGIASAYKSVHFGLARC